MELLKIPLIWSFEYILIHPTYVLFISCALNTLIKKRGLDFYELVDLQFKTTPS